MSRIDPSIFKAYDVRAIYPTEINEDIAYKIGRAYVAYLNVTRVAVSPAPPAAADKAVAAYPQAFRVASIHASPAP